MATNDTTNARGDEQPDEYVLQVTVPWMMYERIELETKTDQTVADWLTEAARIRLALHNASHEETVEVDVDLPPEIRKRARLAMQYAKAQGKDIDLDEYLLNYLTFDYNWQMEE